MRKDEAGVARKLGDTLAPQLPREVSRVKLTVRLVLAAFQC